MKELTRLEFFDSSTGNHCNWIGSIQVNGVEHGGLLQLRADLFSLTMFDTADEWDLATANQVEIQTKKGKLLVIHSKGTTLGGGAIRFG